MQARWAILLVLLEVSASPSSVRSEFFVDGVHGSDPTGDGTASNPWKSIGYASSQMAPGQTCTIRAGTYRELITPRDGQTFQAYPGEQVVISGCDPVGGWSDWQSGIARTALPATVRQVFLNGQRLPKAQHPDADSNMYDTSDWAPTSAQRGSPQGTGSGIVTFTAGLGGVSYDGGFFTGLNGDNAYQANMGRIVRTDGDTLHCDQTNLRWHSSNPGQFDGPGVGYITDHLNALTSPGEWHWEGGFLYLMPPPGVSLHQLQVEARVRLYGFDGSGRSGISLRGLTFRAASVLLDNATDSLIEACDFGDVSPWGRFFDTRLNGDREHYNYGNPEDGTSGIYVNGQGNTIRSCRVARGWGALVTVRGRANTVENNLLEEAGWQCRGRAVNILVNGADHRVLRNTVRRSTGMLIAMFDIDRIPTTAPLVKLNDCRDYGNVMVDDGTSAIYFNGNDDLGGAEISYNFITDNRTSHQRVSCGIYLDDGSHDAKIHHNVIVGNGLTRSGLFTHKGNRQFEVTHNTFWGQGEAGWLSAVWEGTRDSGTMIFRNNLSMGDGFATWGVTGGITEDHNGENVPAGTFMSVGNLDFTLADPASPYIDAGVLLPGADPVPDGEPDLGAYEAGESWKAGAAPDVGAGGGGAGAAGGGGNSSGGCGATGLEVLLLPAVLLALRWIASARRS